MYVLCHTFTQTQPDNKDVCLNNVYQDAVKENKVIIFHLA